MVLSVIKTLDLQAGSNLIIMCGPPGSGKTALAEKIVSEFENFVIVSPDDIRNYLTLNDPDNSTNNVVIFGKVYNQLTEYLQAGNNVIYDATNCRANYRHKILDATEAYTKHTICLLSQTSIIDCLLNNKRNGSSVPDDVVEKMYFTLKHHPPTLFEGYDMIVGFGNV